jgi:hypothetical protein
VKKSGWCEFKKINVEYELIIIWPGDKGTKTRIPIKKYQNCTGLNERCGHYSCMLDPNIGLGAQNPFVKS